MQEIKVLRIILVITSNEFFPWIFVFELGKNYCIYGIIFGIICGINLKLLTKAEVIGFTESRMASKTKFNSIYKLNASQTWNGFMASMKLAKMKSIKFWSFPCNMALSLNHSLTFQKKITLVLNIWIWILNNIHHANFLWLNRISADGSKVLASIYCF